MGCSFPGGPLFSRLFTGVLRIDTPWEERFPRVKISRFFALPGHSLPEDPLVYHTIFVIDGNSV